MGSDMAMERIHIERYARWEMVGDIQYLSIYSKSSFNYQEKLLWRGELNEHNEDLVKVLVAIIPDRPAPVLSKETQVRIILKEEFECSDIEHFDEGDWKFIAGRIVKVFNEQ